VFQRGLAVAVRSAVNAVLPSLPVANPGAEFAAGGDLGATLDMERFVDAVQLLCEVPATELTGVVGYSEDLLDLMASPRVARIGVPVARGPRRPRQFSSRNASRQPT
jgi:hypothetical protein